MSATEIGRRLCPNAVLAGWHDNTYIIVEDVQDPDGRWFRMEYSTSDDGRTGQAWCRHNPWGRNPYDFLKSHLHNDDNHICLGDRPVDLETAIKRARYWCVAFSVLMETGTFPNP